MKPAKLSVVVPVYNEADTLEEVVRRVYAVDIGAVDKDVIICNDGSTDDTSAVIERLYQVYPTLKIYTAPINLGKGAAVRVGMRLSTGDVTIIQDADLELDPGDYPALLAPFADPQVQVVYGSRFLHGMKGSSRSSRWANRGLTFLTNVLFGGRLSDMETAYKVLRREVVQGLQLRCVRFDFEPEITAKLLLAGYKIHEVPVTYYPRTTQQGKKMAWVDGLDALYTLLRCRLFG